MQSRALDGVEAHAGVAADADAEAELPRIRLDADHPAVRRARPVGPAHLVEVLAEVARLLHLPAQLAHLPLEGRDLALQGGGFVLRLVVAGGAGEDRPLDDRAEQVGQNVLPGQASPPDDGEPEEGGQNEQISVDLRETHVESPARNGPPLIVGDECPMNY